jgi:hypothetical protein
MEIVMPHLKNPSPKKAPLSLVLSGTTSKRIEQLTKLSAVSFVIGMTTVLYCS